jgi:hypothetical protein
MIPSPLKPWGSREGGGDTVNSSLIFQPHSRPYAVPPFYGGNFGDSTGGFGFFQPQMAALSNLHYAVGSVGAMIELLSVNASSVVRIARGASSFVEQLGQTAGEVAGFLHLRSSHNPISRQPNADSAVCIAAQRQRIFRWLLGSTAVLIALSITRFAVSIGVHQSSVSEKRLTGLTGNWKGRIVVLLILVLGFNSGFRAALGARRRNEIN